MTEASDRLSLALTGRYRIERELGAGGMATVYLAEDLKHGRKVAIKVLRPELAAVIGADRFVREIRTIAALQHPHILGADRLGRGQRHRVLRDALCRRGVAARSAEPGEATADSPTRFGSRAKLPRRWITPTATASSTATSSRRTSCSTTAPPSSPTSASPWPSSSAGGSRMTETGMSLGTPHYMSPEQAMGEREITARSDVYALGAMTYEMLLGEPPFSGPTAQAIVAKVLTEAPRPLTPRRHSIPPEVEDAVLTALEKLPADRFGSAAEFASRTPGRNEGTPEDCRTAPSEGRRLQAAMASWGWAWLCSRSRRFSWDAKAASPLPHL